ncbi:dihydroorotate dehydrogenase electron transfer subunit [Pelosinus propionicus]|uniref:Dihydroorotate dehydrogenase B (NAD(+)), electron transfer subunit n=1 Tax=Pelosinus propionicus DSM 13327 TaxID=1123291 RepID=A0A1I4LMH7_9FIRM|nr:dihydroorotate dehydrogenase electron transfer subunit [Pelosinus propionicus]SFL91807.1 dihydroorotate dehydrogenase electron transfer subunit [Pelosinus propionicus DSM 13327]
MPKMVVEARIVRNTEIGVNVKELVLYAPEIAAQAVPGQFLHVRVSDSYHPLLRRPLSISDADRQAGTISTIYRVVGQGTACLAALTSEDSVNCMGPLGNGFALQSQRPLLVGGGMGLAPLLFLAGALCPHPIEILMGGRTREEMFWADMFHGKCDAIHITTDDGTLGSCGVTLDVLPEVLKNGAFDLIYTCGPRIMMEGVAKVAKKHNIPCQVSLEDYMACGIGGCLSCTCAGKNGTRKKVCSDGPVFWAQEVMA